MAKIELSNGVSYFVEDRGTGSAVLFVHGWGTSGMVFEGQVVALVSSYRVVTLDWRGCGRSDHPAWGNTVAQVARDLREIVEQLNLEPVVLVGSSLGGNIVLEYLAQDSTGVRGAVVVDAPQHWFSDGLDSHKFFSWVASLRHDRPQVFTNMVSTWFGPKVGDAMCAWTVDQLLRSSWFIDDILVNAQTHDLRSQLSSITVPVALFHGAHDFEVPLAVSEHTTSLLPKGKLVVFDDCGHMPHLENPSQFNYELIRFLEALPAIAV